MIRRRPPSPTWRTFLANQVTQLTAADFFVVPTATYRFLFVLVILAHDRRRVVHLAVTANPIAAWAAQQLREAFPWDETRRYLVRDRDHAFDGLGEARVSQSCHRAERERAPSCVERIRRLLHGFAHASRAQEGRAGTALGHPPILGHVVAVPQVGGLHHRYERRAA
jgi:putative transposase